MGFRKQLLIVVSVFLIGCSGSSDSVVRAPKWEPILCQQQDSVNVDTECGYLIVPENRQNPDSREIKIYVTIIHNPNALPDSPPLLYLTGGPGAPTSDAITIFETYPLFRDAFGRGRDIIILDQRGTNRSIPALYCGQELAPARQAAYGMSFAEAADKRVPLEEACYQRLVNEGIDLSGYNTVENATDIRDLAQVLGYRKFKIYAASYGTRLAMITMKLFPEILDSVVLDSVLPPEINPYLWEVNATNFSLQTFYQAALDPYPDVRLYVETIIARLDANPVEVTVPHKRQPTDLAKLDDFLRTHMPDGAPPEPPARLSQGADEKAEMVRVTVTGPKFVGYLIGQLRQTPFDNMLPSKIYKLYQDQDYSAVAQSWIGTVDFFWPAGGPGSEATAIGMYNSVFAADDAYYTTPEDIEARIKLLLPNPAIASWQTSNYIRMEPAVLGKWPVTPLPPSELDPIYSVIPNMMLVGTLDQATPSIFSENSTVGLPNSFYFRILAGHATSYIPCVVEMIDHYLLDHSVPPAYSCPISYDWQ